MGVAAGKDYAAGWAQTSALRLQLGAEPNNAALAEHICWGVPLAHKGCWGLLDPALLRRWMVPLELAAASGFFTVTPILAQAAQLPGGVTAHIAKSHVGAPM